MTTAQYIAGGLAVLVIAGPTIYWAITHAVETFFSDDGDHPLAKRVGPDFETAVSHLAQVRSRLIQTDLLGDEAKKAIDVLTLALVAGSDK